MLERQFELLLALVHPVQVQEDIGGVDGRIADSLGSGGLTDEEDQSSVRPIIRWGSSSPESHVAL